MYLYCGAAKNEVDIEESLYAGHMQPAEVVQLWSDVMPSDSVLVADTYFGSHEVAATLADQKRPFLMPTKRSELGVEEASAGLRPGETNSVVNVEHGYSLTVFKNPKVGKKPARCVPFLTNCDMGPRGSARYQAWWGNTGGCHQV